MSWNYQEYPPSMRDLNERVRNRAIDIANALLEDGYTSTLAVAIAVAQAQKWADDETGSEQNLHVVPHPEGWAIRRNGSLRVSFVMPSREDARNYAIEIARDEGRDVILYHDDGQIEHYIDLIEDEDTTTRY